MLEKVFLQILNMSLTAGVVILFVLAARLLLKRAPKIFSYALWGIVLFRLVCPFSFESVLSLLPTNPAPIPTDIVYSPAPRVDTGIPAVDQAVNPVLPPAAPEEESLNPMQVLVFAGSLLWLAGIAVLLGYNCIRLEKLRRKLRYAVREEGNVYRAEGLESPFVLGLFRPNIYLPAGLNDEERQYILLHERTHIRRGDHVIKFVGFLVLCLHWFNPLVWAAFFLFGRDMEMSCDESVIRQLGSEAKKSYSATLLALATGKRIVGGTPLAFGEGDAKGRIKNVLNYRKPAFWMFLLLLLAVAALIVGLIANPRETKTALAPEELAGRFAEVWQAKWETVEGHDTMLLGQGKAFLADVTGDSQPELFFLYDNYKLSGVVVYDISGGDVRELGGFDASSFSNNAGLRFTFYQKGSERLVRTDSTFYGPAADPRNTVTDVFASVRNGTLSRIEPAPCRIVAEDGSETVYLSSDQDNTPITEEAYNRRVSEILDGYEEAETILLEPGVPPFSFLDGEALRDTIRTLAEKGNAGTAGIRTVSGTEPPPESGTSSREETPEAGSPYSLRWFEDGYQLSISSTPDFPELSGKNEGAAFLDEKNGQLHVSIITGIGHPKPGEVEGPVGSLAGASVRFDMDIQSGKILSSEFQPGASPEQMTLSISETRLSEIGRALMREIDRQISTGYAEAPSEEEFLRAVVNSAEITNGTIRLSLPPLFPNGGNEFSLEVYGFYEDSPGSHARLDFFKDISGTSSWEAGKTYEETPEEPIPDGAEISFFASFVNPEEGIQTSFQLRKLIWKNGAAKDAVLAKDTVVSPKLTPSAAGTDAELVYTESDGGTFRARLTLPAGWTLRPQEAGAAGLLFAEMEIYNGEKKMGSVGYDIFEFHPEASDENFQVSVYNSLMLGSVVNWNNEYQVVSGNQREASAATCEVYYAPNGAGGGTYTHKGILSHDTALERFIAIEFTDDSVTGEEWLSIAKSIRLSN